MTSASLLKNAEFKRLAAWLGVCSLLLLAGLAAFQSWLWQGFQRQMVARDIAIVGSLADLPDLQAGLIASLTRPISPTALQEGLAAAERYGLTPDAPLTRTPVYLALYRRSLWGTLALASVWAGGTVLLVGATGRLFYRRFRTLSLGAEQVMRGEFSLRLPDEGEGELPMLGFQFNQMAARLQSTLGELVAEKRMLKETVSDISHQLKTPLASLRTFNDLLLDGAADDPAVRQEFLQRTSEQLDRMDWLIQTLLTLARLETGALTIQRGPADLAETVCSVVAGLEEKSAAKRQGLTLREAGDPLMIPHDPHWLGEAISNVVKNAIEYSPEATAIAVALERTGTAVRVVVRDQGPGIAPDDLPHIFERFYRGRHAVGPEPNGTGIGLALSRLIVEKHGGHIRAESEPGQGTTITITLPRTPA